MRLWLACFALAAFELGCSCHTRAEWVDLDELELVCDGPLSKLLRTYYLPGVKRQLEEEVKFLDLAN